MRRMSFLTIAMMAVAGGTAHAKQPPYEYGPPPVWHDFKEQGEAALRATLRDPDSAKIHWDTGYAPGQWFVGIRPSHGYLACGHINAKNAYGGYTGDTIFAVVFDHGQVQATEIDHTLASVCRNANLPAPPPDTEPPQQTANAPANLLEDSPDPARAPFGLQLTAVPDGAYVSAVAPASAAAKAGIRPGMVIERLNGLTVKRVGISALDEMIASSHDRLTLTMIGGQSFTLTGAGQ